MAKAPVSPTLTNGSISLSEICGAVPSASPGAYQDAKSGATNQNRGGLWNCVAQSRAVQPQKQRERKCYEQCPVLYDHVAFKCSTSFTISIPGECSLRIHVSLVDPHSQLFHLPPSCSSPPELLVLCQQYMFMCASLHP